MELTIIQREHHLDGLLLVDTVQEQVHQMHGKVELVEEKHIIMLVDLVAVAVLVVMVKLAVAVVDILVELLLMTGLGQDGEMVAEVAPIGMARSRSPR